jgi:hypothetical protein
MTFRFRQILKQKKNGSDSQKFWELLFYKDQAQCITLSFLKFLAKLAILRLFLNKFYQEQN